ncbi:putative Ig domain-containing protein [Myxococcus sp. AM011]|uniref:putative Ig domain-containing protein n=1 Tax=Myxococcus sp. AM011 TaxID=2745200 RepID=UPI0015956348|nr:putative Ig domain-containing protein [Myxococcus sp. AM011]NVJ22117.1 putative Ig domain-containing protein [Myxococcus sp. AM011]
MRFHRALALLFALSLTACPGSKPTTPLLPEQDAGPTPTDAGPTPTDAGPTPADGGPTPIDAGPTPADGGHTSLTFETATLSDAYVGDAYSAPLAVSGGSPPYAWTLISGALPPGLTLLDSGGLQGTLSAGGTSTFSLRATDALGATATRELSVTIYLPPTLAPVSPQLVYVRDNIARALEPSGGKAPFVFTTPGPLPPGLTLAPEGLLHGQPTQDGAFTFEVLARDANGRTTTRSVTFTVAALPSITTLSLSDATLSAPYQQTLGATGGRGLLTWTLASGSPPPGLTLSPQGTLSGTPSFSGTASITVRVSDESGRTDQRTLALIVYAPPAITSTPSDGYATTAYTASLTASGGRAPFTWSVASGALPSGLSLAPGSGILSGTLGSSVGTHNLTLRVTDSAGRTSTRAVTLSVYSLPVVTGAATSLDGYVTVPVSAVYGASGGKPPYTFDTPSTLPSGLTLSSDGRLTGTPSVPGPFSLQVRASDSNGRSALRPLALSIFALPSITTSTLPEADTGEPYSATLSVSGGKAPFSWSVVSGSLPAGLSLSNSGTVSGTTPSSTGSTFTVRASDTNGRVADRALSLAVYVPPSVTTTTVPMAVSGQPYSATLAASGGRAPLTWSHVGTLPTGLSLSSSGVISGTPTEQGTRSFSAVVQDAKGTSASSALSLTVSGSGQVLTVGHWNIEWFGADNQGPPASTSPGGTPDDLQLAHAGDILSEAGANVWGLVEMVDSADFQVLKAQLPQYDGFLANDWSYVSNASSWYSAGEQKPGILYDSSLVFQRAELILTANDFSFGGRPPLRVDFTTVINGAPTPISVIVLHMKAFDDVDSYTRRQEASIALKAYLDALPTARVFVLGDWNDDVDRSITRNGGVNLPTPFQNLLDDPTHYTFITKVLSERSERTTTEYPDTIDHTLVSDEVAAVYVPNSVRVVRPDTRILNYNNIVSDHYPVVSRYDFGGGGESTDGGTQTPPAMLINEVLANEPAVPTGDGGTAPDTDHEFVEVINTGGSTADLSGWSLWDSNVVRHTFATGTLVAPGRAYVIFGGSRGFPLGTPDTAPASTGTLGLNNGGDGVSLRDSTGALVDVMTYTGTVDNVSLNRSPDAFPGTDFVLHTTLNPSLGSSPGRRANGNAF